MKSKFKWGIISTGRIAGKFAAQIPQSKTGELFAVASRNKEKAKAFADKYGIPKSYGCYQELLDDPEVDIVYIATPHPQHAEWSIKAARAKKHNLCEKPLTLNYNQAREVINEARNNDVFLMEAFHYRCHPQTKKLIELIKDNAIGELRVIQGAFSFHSPYGPEHRTLDHALAGGGVLDVGCYPVSMVRLLAGAALGRDFAEPLEVKGCGRIGKESRVDEYASACMKFPEGIIAEVSCGVTVQRENVLRIYGSKGRITVPTPWVVSLDGGTSKILVHLDGKDAPEEIDVTAEQGLFAIEADTACEFIPQRQASPPAMSWDDSLGQMKTLDLWRASIGLLYDMEKSG